MVYAARWRRSIVSSIRAPRTAINYRNRHSDATSTNDKLKILFLGRDEFSCLVLAELYKARDVWDELVVATNPDQRVGRRGGIQTTSPLKRMVEPLHDVRLEFIPPSKPEFRQWALPSPFSSHIFGTDLSSTTPPAAHVLVTASFGRILTRKQLSHFLPTRRLNVHPSLLPQYRGPAPIQHALMNGEKETGVCVIEMLPATLKKQQPTQKSGIDAGDVWKSTSVPQPDYATFDQMRDILGRKGGQLVVEVLRNIRNGDTAPVPQQVDTAVPLRPAPMIQLEDALFDPSHTTAEEIWRRWKAIGHQRPISTFLQITSRAGSPLSRRAVQLHDIGVEPQNAIAEVLPSSPGAVVFSEGALLIRCIDGGVVAVRKIKPEGKAVLDAREFWNGVGVQNKDKELRFVGSEGA